MRDLQQRIREKYEEKSQYILPQQVQMMFRTPINVLLERGEVAMEIWVNTVEEMSTVLKKRPKNRLMEWLNRENTYSKESNNKGR